MQTLEDIPQWFADYFTISLAAAQAILSIVVLLLVLLPTLIVSNNKNSAISVLLLGFVTLCGLVAIEWCPFWVLIGAACIMAFGVAALGSKAITGG